MDILIVGFIAIAAIFLFTRNIFDKPKWKIVYHLIAEELMDGVDVKIIEDKLTQRYNLTPVQAEQAIKAVKEEDISWFENSEWK